MAIVHKLSLGEFLPLVDRLRQGHSGLDQLLDFLQGFQVRIDLPGIDEQDIDLNFTGNILQISRKKSVLEQDREERIIAVSAKMRLALGIAEKIAATDKSVLIYGATGTGKDLFARTIHRLSSRRDAPFVWLPGGTLNKENVEQQLRHTLEAADTGTLFFDELEDFEPLVQQQLLAVLEKPRSFRIISATSADLSEAVLKQEFSGDLAELLQECYIELEELSRRKEEIAPLVRYHLDRLCREKGVSPKEPSPEYLALLEAYSWPGNVRELINTLEQSLLVAREKKTLFVKDLPAHIRIRTMQTVAQRKRGV